MAPLNSTATDAELPVEGVAARLGLPVGMLIRRIEAGDIPARRDDSTGEPHFHLRLSDLGITPEEAAVFQGNQLAAGRRRGGRDGVPVIDLTGRASPAPAVVPDRGNSSGSHVPPRAGAAVDAPGQPVVRGNRRSPRRKGAADEPGSGAGLDSGVAADGHPERDPAPADDADRRSAPDGVQIEDILPPPRSVTAEVAIVDHPAGPRSELASMTIDPHELVAGLLDRWERTLEQRIYAEQRQRFEGELNSRLHQVKELRVELQTARAEHAVAQAEKDLILAAKERELADRERALAEERARPKRRGWFGRG